jgi:trehalose 6-phosphate synthase/phosphatase
MEEQVTLPERTSRFRPVAQPEPQRKLVVLTCRQPDPTAALKKGTSGGLVAALGPAMESSRGTWISGCPVGYTDGEADGAAKGSSNGHSNGHSNGTRNGSAAGARVRHAGEFAARAREAGVTSCEPPYRSVAVKYPGNLHDGFYTGLANGVLWPLYHSMLQNAAVARSSDWRDYRRVNQYFAAVAAEQASPGSFVWVHDYQLSLVPELLREICPEHLEIGFFLHTPFPCFDILRAFPWAREILRGMLAADLVGFHTEDYCKNFCESANKLLGLPVDPARGEIEVDGRVVRVRAVPVGIDVQAIHHWLDDPWVQQRAAELRRQLGGERLLLGVDRLDYTKGIDRRLEAVDLLFERHPELRGRVVFAQIAVPSRVDVPAYQQLRLRIEQLVGHVNARWSDEHWTPVKLFGRSYPLRELVAWYLAADVGLVTPYRDGMNLVAKEYCAAHRDRPGTLVLSELAGAAGDLAEAFSVNPYNLEGMTETIRRSLHVNDEEARCRMSRMNQRIQRRDAHQWVKGFLHQARCR